MTWRFHITKMSSKEDIKEFFTGKKKTFFKWYHVVKASDLSPVKM